MSYMCVYDMAQDENLTKRIAGCVANDVITDGMILSAVQAVLDIGSVE